MLDVTDQASIDHAREQVEAATAGHGLDVLVNVAGTLVLGPVEAVSDQQTRAQFAVNLFGSLAVTRAFLPPMRERRDGRIVNVSSILGRFALPGSGLYSASKFAMEAYSDALRMELAPFAVRVVLIEPGVIDTSLYEAAAAGLSGYDEALEPYRALFTAGFGFPERLLNAAASLDGIATTVAQAVLDENPRARYRPGLRNRLSTRLLTVLPTRFSDRIKSQIAGLASAAETAGAVPTWCVVVPQRDERREQKAGRNECGGSWRPARLIDIGRTGRTKRGHVRPLGLPPHVVHRHRPAGEPGGWWVPTFPTSRCLHHRRLSRLRHRTETREMLLKDKVAVIYGAGGAIGGAVALAFGREGAKLFVTGRPLAPVEAVAKEVVAAGGFAEAAEVDAADEQAVDEHLQSVIDKAGRVDISFNAVGIPDTQIVGVPLVDLDVERFSLPIMAYATSYFLTARLAARRMVANKSGVIMTVTAIPSRTGTPLNGGYGPAQAAKEALTRELSAELAPEGIRVVGLRPSGIPETGSLKEVFDAKATGLTWEQWQERIASRSHARRLSTLEETANMAVFMASDKASGMTGTIVNLTMGSLDD